jgi:hypothetical protein
VPAQVAARGASLYQQEVSREVRRRYDDPLDLIWLACARACGIRVQRSDDVYASWDGQGTLTLSTREHFDADDSLAQLVFHELCHALVAGPRRLTLPDWGMENVDERDLVQEHACHRVQAALADRHGLRALFAVTTDHRTYWDALPVDPLGSGDDPAIPLAKDAYVRATNGPWASAIERALSRSRELCALVREAGVPQDSVFADTRELHRTGFPRSNDAQKTCGDCAWSFGSEQGLRCRHTRLVAGARGLRVNANDQACVRFEPTFDDRECARCGACCREAFDRVEVRAQDLVRKRHPELVLRDGYGDHLPRPGGRCVALEGDGVAGEYRCRIYVDRPRSCAEFALRGDACLTARRRVGKSH